MNFNIKIDLDKVILIGKDANFNVKYKSEIETKWLLIKGIEDKIFCLRSNEIETEYPSDLVKEIMKSNYEIIDLEKRIKGKVKTIIDKEISKIFEESMDKEDFALDYDIKENVNQSTGEITVYKEYQIINEAYQFGKNLRDDEYRTRYLNLGITEINKGLISVMETNIKYDLINDKFLNTDREIVLAFYNENEIRHILSYEKYKCGIGSTFYSEIAKINEFLQDKKSITVKLKNGTIFKTDAILRNIFDISSTGDIFIAQNYSQTIIEGENFRSYQYKINQLESLRYGKNELKINSKNLMIERNREK